MVAVPRIEVKQKSPAFANGAFCLPWGYLSGSKEARQIAQAWLAAAGLLSDIRNLNELGRTMLTNVAPNVAADPVARALSVTAEPFAEKYRKGELLVFKGETYEALFPFSKGCLPDSFRGWWKI